MQCQPDLLSPIDLTVGSPDPIDLTLKHIVPLGPVRPKLRAAKSRGMTSIRRWGDLQNSANRLDPKAASMLINKGPRYFKRRSSSAWAKKALASFKISLARLSSRTSSSSSLTRGHWPPHCPPPYLQPWQFSSSRSVPCSQSSGPPTQWQPTETHDVHAALRPCESLALAALGKILFVCL